MPDIDYKALREAIERRHPGDYERRLREESFLTISGINYNSEATWDDQNGHEGAWECNIEGYGKYSAPNLSDLLTMIREQAMEHFRSVGLIS